MLYPVQFPKRAVCLLGCMRSGKTLMLLSHAAAMSKAIPAVLGRNTLIVTEPHALDDARQQFTDLGGDPTKVIVLSFAEQSSIVFPKLSQLNTIVFDIATIKRADGVHSYTEPSERMVQFLKTLNEFTAISPYVAFSAHEEHNLEHPAMRN